MPGKTNVFSEDILKLIFNGTTISNIANNASVSPLTTLYLSLHHTDPSDTPANGQSTNELTYGGYARQQLVRTNAGWSVAGKVATTVLNVDFPQVTSGSGTAYYLGVGTAASGNGKLLYTGLLTPAIAYAIGTIPRINAGTTVTEE